MTAPKWLLALRNGLVVLGLLVAYNIVQSHSVTLDDFLYSLGIAGIWTMYELTRVFHIKIDGIEKLNKSPLLVI